MLSKYNKESIIIVQIESIDAVMNLPSIIDNEFIDAVIVGPYDISGSIGIPGKINDKKVRDAANKVLKICNEYGKSCGIHIPTVTPKSLKKVITDGFNFIILSSDVFVLRDWAINVNEISEQWLSQRKS